VTARAERPASRGARVVITGVGLRCASGASSIVPVECHARPDADAAALGIHGVARVVDVKDDPADGMFPDDRKGVLAREALDDVRAGCDGARIGLFLGTGLSSLTPDEAARDLYPHLRPDGSFDRAALARDLATDRPSPRRHDPARVTRVLAARLGATLHETSFSACAAAAQSMAEAARAVARGEVDVAFGGGHDSMLHPLGLLSFVILGALSPTGGRPFDRTRDGFLIGEGAAILRFEREQDARARGATVLARWLGAGTSVDAYNVTAPHPEGHGAALAMRRALADADMAPSDVDYVNAHGTGTPVGDRAEALAVSAVLGDVPVSSFKGAVGHTVAAAGAVELALCLAAFSQGITPGTVGLAEVDPELRANVLRSPLMRRPRVILSNSVGFGGQNCAVAIGAP
jgi:3-oxoacyl-(acyl-carrier-protein) synthase